MNNDERDFANTENPEKLVSVDVLGNEIEEHLISEILDDVGIPFFIKLFDTNYMSDVYELTHGRSQLFVSGEYKDEAMRLLAELRNSQIIIEDEDAAAIADGGEYED